jgi:hypothetical protein
MKYADYNNFVAQWGIELVGWTEGTGVCPIERINTAPQLQRLLMALNTGACHWKRLTADDWAGHARLHTRSDRCWSWKSAGAVQGQRHFMQGKATY